MLFDRGDYQSLSRDIRETYWESLKSNDIDIYASNITNRISEPIDKYKCISTTVSMHLNCLNEVAKINILHSCFERKIQI